MHRMFWKEDVSCFFGTVDVEWATPWRDSIATSGCIADAVGVSWLWGQSLSRTESTKDDENCHICSISGLLLQLPSARRGSSCLKSVFRCLTPKVASCLKGVTMTKGLEDQAREVARVEGQPAGTEEDIETIDENWPEHVPKSARCVSGRQYHRLRMQVDHLLCRDGRSEKSPAHGAESSKDTRRKTESPNRSGEVAQISHGARVPSGRRRRVEIDAALVAYSND